MVETQLCKLRDTSDTFVGRAYSIFPGVEKRRIYCPTPSGAGQASIDHCGTSANVELQYQCSVCVGLRAGRTLACREATNVARQWRCPFNAVFVSLDGMGKRPRNTQSEILTTR